MTHPRRRCPVCGIEQLLSNLQAHVGSARCLLDLQRIRQGRVHDLVDGPKALVLARELSELLKKPQQPA